MASVNWRVTSLGTSCHPIKMRTSECLEWVANYCKSPALYVHSQEALSIGIILVKSNQVRWPLETDRTSFHGPKKN